MTFVIKVHVQILHLHHVLDIEDLLRPHWTILLLLLLRVRTAIKSHG